jgi:hypothetical protein
MISEIATVLTTRTSEPGYIATRPLVPIVGITFQTFNPYLVLAFPYFIGKKTLLSLQLFPNLMLKTIFLSTTSSPLHPVDHVDYLNIAEDTLISLFQLPDLHIISNNEFFLLFLLPFLL